ncbi:hypothetical protein Ae201684P_014341 [Aphanomyces euteiches]|nr:hypothetical protein Ae201684P_014341 [Aphanomyces euteiches]
MVIVQYNPANPSPTGNLVKEAPPLHFDVMQEYWGSKRGYLREPLMTTDDVSEEDFDSQNEQEYNQGNIYRSTNQTIQHRPNSKRAKKELKQARARGQRGALEAGLMAIKEGLVFLGQSTAAVPPNNQMPNESQSVATMDDLMTAIKSRNETLTKLNYLTIQNQNKQHELNRASLVNSQP